MDSYYQRVLIFKENDEDCSMPTHQMNKQNWHRLIRELQNQSWKKSSHFEIAATAVLRVPPHPNQTSSPQLPKKPPPEEVGFSGFCFLAMLLRRFAKIPVGIFAFVAASSAVGHSSKYNLSSCLSWYDLHFSIFSARAWNRLQNISKHCTDITTWQPLYVLVGFKRCTLSSLHT